MVLLSTHFWLRRVTTEESRPTIIANSQHLKSGKKRGISWVGRYLRTDCVQVGAPLGSLGEEKPVHLGHVEAKITRLNAFLCD